MPTQPATAAKTYLHSIVTLRGIFVLIVCFFHFAAGVRLYNECYDCVAIAHQLGMPACLGFFIISGFGIPWSMHLTGYRPGFVHVFYLKRLIRVEPPYVLSLLIVLLVPYLLSLLPNGKPFSISLTQIGLHLGYLISFSDYKWLSPVYWTLAVEFQYYVTIALFYPLVASRNALLRNGSLLALMTVYFLTPHLKSTLNTYVPLFLIGIVLFHWRAGIGSRREHLVWLSVLLPTGLTYMYGPVMVGVIVLCAAMILKDDHESRVGEFFGDLAYAMYLLHTTVAVLLITALEPWLADLWGKLAVILLCYIVTVAISRPYWRWVERPSQKLSQSIRYRHRAASTSRAASVDTPPAVAAP